MFDKKHVMKNFVLMADLLLPKSPKMILNKCFSLNRYSCLDRSYCLARQFLQEQEPLF